MLYSFFMRLLVILVACLLTWFYAISPYLFPLSVNYNMPARQQFHAAVFAQRAVKGCAATGRIRNHHDASYDVAVRDEAEVAAVRDTAVIFLFTNLNSAVKYILESF